MSVTSPRFVPHWTREPNVEFRVEDLIVTVTLASDELTGADALALAVKLASLIGDHDVPHV